MKQSEIILEAAVYDPSHRCADTASYWQWTNNELGEQWDWAAECVNMGWPTKCELKDRSARWYGVMLLGSGDFWVYRVFAAGNDRFGREGRYFFVLIRLRSPEGLLSLQVAGLFSYFDTERGLPLKTEPLDHGWQDTAPDEILKAISEELVRGGRAGHWGMDAAGRITVFNEGKPMLPEHPKPASEKASFQKTPTPSETTGNFKLNYGWVIVVVAGILFLFPTRRQINSPPNLPNGTNALPTEAQPSGETRTGAADKETGRPEADARAPSQDTDSKQESIPMNEEPSNPESSPNANDDPSPPDQTPDPSPQPPIESPENPTRP